MKYDSISPFRNLAFMILTMFLRNGSFWALLWGPGTYGRVWFCPWHPPKSIDYRLLAHTHTHNWRFNTQSRWPFPCNKNHLFVTWSIHSVHGGRSWIFVRWLHARARGDGMKVSKSCASNFSCQHTGQARMNGMELTVIYCVHELQKTIPVHSIMFLLGDTAAPIDMHLSRSHDLGRLHRFSIHHSLLTWPHEKVWDLDRWQHLKEGLGLPWKQDSWGGWQIRVYQEGYSLEV